jgi:uncharacterized glyoxalase superfamily protein PhnB
MAGIPLPEGYHSVNPYIVVDGAERLIDFLVEVFGGVEQGAACALMAASSMAMCASVTRW